MSKYIPNGKGKGKWSHGFSRKPETRYLYRIMERMIRRCGQTDSKQFKDYGGRGITVCEEWNHPSKFLAFFMHVGQPPTPKHTIERIDNNRGYEPGNVRWATRAEQMRNTRRNVFITFRGETLCRRDMANRYGLPDWTVKKRLKNGWTLEDALLKPIDPKYQHAAA